MIESGETRRTTALPGRLILLMSLIFGSLITTAAHAQIRVVSYNIAQGRGDAAALEEVLTETGNDDRTGPAYPVSIFVFQEVTQEDFDWLSQTLSAEYTAGTYTNSNEDPFGGAQALFYRADTVTEISSGHDGTFTGAGRRARRWQMRLLGYSNPPIEFFIYSGHLKAGTSSDNQEEREFGMNNILNNIDELSGSPSVLLCGDFNLYSANEAAYELMLNNSIIDFVDPVGAGSWAGESNALKHTQSPRAVTGGGLASGGLDDRFDFLIPSTGLVGNRGFTLIDGTVRAVGNDGAHYNQAINEGTNSYYPGQTARSNELANAVHDASDHLPVAADFRFPAEMDAFMFNAGFGTVIAGATVSLNVTVANVSSPAYVGGGSSMEWFLDGTENVAGVSGGGLLAPGESGQYSFSLTPGAGGQVAGNLLIRSNDPGVQNQPVIIPLSGTVLRAAEASFSEVVDIDWNFASFTVQADSGVQVLEVPIWNFGWDIQQARLDIDAVTGVDSPFSFVDGLTTGITSSPALLRFALDTDGREPGTVADALEILASDEDFVGATDQVLNLSLSVSVEPAPVECPGDLNGSGTTDVEDLLALLKGFGTLYDVDDLLVCLGDWNCSTTP